ncbi:hypothetical protein V6N12_057038 [Hibiscus sabdariffa]|uniref:Uncharacterized protein n=1 Tax=Hibiscus sabdariffa TaxID=183260 RepID=A0ABR2DDQ6_9ROSI
MARTTLRRRQFHSSSSLRPQIPKIHHYPTRNNPKLTKTTYPITSSDEGSGEGQTTPEATSKGWFRFTLARGTHSSRRRTERTTPEVGSEEGSKWVSNEASIELSTRIAARNRERWLRLGSPSGDGPDAGGGDDHEPTVVEIDVGQRWDGIGSRELSLSISIVGVADRDHINCGSVGCWVY